jgi:hypothetical protein
MKINTQAKPALAIAEGTTSVSKPEPAVAMAEGNNERQRPYRMCISAPSMRAFMDPPPIAVPNLRATFSPMLSFCV